jgi:propionyl-CoA carboxylase alpha chain
VFGVDLVELQLRVAEGRSSAEMAAGTTTSALDPRGHAVEVRLYAEDPAADWQPQSGILSLFEVPGVAGEFDLLNRPVFRFDAGFAGGDEVSTYYDAMLAKVIAWAPTRAQAARRLADALARARIHGVVTNRDLLVAVLRSERFAGGDVATDFLDSLPEVVRPDPQHAATAAALALAETTAARRTVQHGIPVAWRNVVSQPQVTGFTAAGDELEVAWRGGRDGYAVDGLAVVSVAPHAVTLEADGIRTTYDVTVTGDVVDVDSPQGHVALRRRPRFTDPADAVASGSLLAPMPGTVVGVAVEVGAAVVAGQPVLVLEAMKMQHTVSAPYAGVVSRIEVTPGTQVAAGEVLAVVDQGEEPA